MALLDLLLTSQGLASRLAELLAAQFGTASGSSAQPICLDSAGSGAAGGAAGSAVSRDPLAAVGQSCLIPVLMRELTNATFTGQGLCVTVL